MKGSKKEIGFARSLRQRQTDAEEVLWFRLRNMQFNGIKFRRQQPLGRYVVDFVSYDRKLVIEIDGSQHTEEPTVEKDRRRTRRLNSQGFRVVRFWSNDVLTNTDGVVERIGEILEDSAARTEREDRGVPCACQRGDVVHPHPNLPPSRGKGATRAS
ncbi:MAG: endonuclease domain-containing protein [Chloroflexi bacterium]|nr:endonuclease domain-containing protein [Chloroflexota bacterium]